MNTKTAVTWALILSFFAAGNIFLFGLLDASNFSLAYLAFALAGSGLIISAVGGLLSRADLALVVVLLVLLSLPLTFFAGSLKAYEASATGEQQKMMADVADIAAKNDYYASYIDYMESQVGEYENSSLMLESKISEMRKEIALLKAAPPVAPPVVENPPVYEVPQNRHERDDDDEHEDDDDD